MAGDSQLILPPGARAILCAPDAVTRTLAATESDPRAAREPDRKAIWLLRGERAVRASYLAEVLDGQG